jgi:hypothetical protein
MWPASQRSLVAHADGRIPARAPAPGAPIPATSMDVGPEVAR